ncbi:MAG: hypothetical protein PHE83_14920 [Opitutaceae bacterium]|nr:hypothetical protein [Opitutaceae bacterium]
MNIQAAFTFSAYRYHPLDLRVPLAERFPGRALGYASYGPGGLSLASVRHANGQLFVSHHTTDPQAGGMPPAEIASRIRAVARPGSLFGPTPVILGVSSKLEWHIKTAVEAAGQEDFVYQLRTEPQKILSGANVAINYTGLLHDGSGLIFGVHGHDLNLAGEALQRARYQVVRRTVPALAVMNLLLADPRVTRHEMLPLVVDQGFAVCLLTDSNVWKETQGQPFLGANTGTKDLADLVERIRNFDAIGKFLVAISPANGGMAVEDALRGANAELTRFTLNHLPEEDLFPYACALF